MSTKKRSPKKYVREGDTFGRATVQGDDTARSGKRYVWCLCSCGVRWSVMARSLTSGNTQSCGCLWREKVAAASRLRATHGQSIGRRQSKAYRTYVNILKRCYDPKCDQFPNYGGRGIGLCARWKADRAAFFADMGEPTADDSIDRIDNDGGYWCGSPECPDCGPAGRAPNCRWATRDEQAVNRRNNRQITFDGRTQSLVEWSRETGIDYAVLQVRLDDLGWPLARAFTEPVRGADRFEFRGENLTLDQWAERTGLARSTIAQRIKKLGWSVEKSLTTASRARST